MRARRRDRTIAFVATCSIAGFALLLRVIAALRFQLIEHDGAYYADLARTLLAGNFGRGFSTVWPPVEPLGIAGVAVLLHAAGAAMAPETLETAARIFSIACGVGLLVPVYALARRLLPVPGALAAAALVAAHARLIQYSGSALSESAFTLALVAGVAAFLHRRRAWAGILFGIAYLTRPEGLLLGLLVGLVDFVASRRPGPVGRSRLVAGRGSAVFFLALALTVTPYVAFVSTSLHRFSLGEKGDYNLWVAHRDAYARHLPPPILLANRVNTSPSIAPESPAREFRPLTLLWHEPAAVAARTASYFARIVTSSYPIALHPVFTLLALLGLWRLPARRWTPVLVVLAALPFLYAPFSFDRRFFVPAIPFAVLLAARGCVVAGRTFARRTGGRASVPAVAKTLVALLVAGQVLYFTMRVRGLDEAPELRAAGTWLRAHGPAHPVVQARGPWVSFYADGTTIKLPDMAVEELADQARERGANVIAIDSRAAPKAGSPLQTLLDAANAPPGLRFLHRIAEPDSVALYEVMARNGTIRP